MIQWLLQLLRIKSQQHSRGSDNPGFRNYGREDSGTSPPTPLLGAILHDEKVDIGTQGKLGALLRSLENSSDDTVIAEAILRFPEAGLRLRIATADRDAGIRTVAATLHQNSVVCPILRARQGRDFESYQ